MDWYAICSVVSNLKMYPVFEIAHYILIVLNMRKELLNTVPGNFEKRHPLASWLSSVMLCFSGGIFNCFLFGKPLANVIQPERVLYASLVWYVLNFVPGISALLSSRPIMTLIAGMKEIHRAYGVYQGIDDVPKDHLSNYLLIFTSGFLRGCASEIMMFTARLMAGVVKPNSYQFMAPNVFLFPSSLFKASAVLAVVYTLEVKGHFVIDHNILFTCSILILIYLRVMMVWSLMGDPFQPIENLVCAIFFGGMWDAYLRVKESNQSSNANGDGKLKRS